VIVPPPVLTVTPPTETTPTVPTTPGTSAVPEPATWGMMLLGFAMIGGALRRGRKPARQGPAR